MLLHAINNYRASKGVAVTLGRRFRANRLEANPLHVFEPLTLRWFAVQASNISITFIIIIGFAAPLHQHDVIVVTIALSLQISLSYCELNMYKLHKLVQASYMHSEVSAIFVFLFLSRIEFCHGRWIHQCHFTTYPHFISSKWAVAHLHSSHYSTPSRHAANVRWQALSLEQTC